MIAFLDFIGERADIRLGMIILIKRDIPMLIVHENSGGSFGMLGFGFLKKAEYCQSPSFLP